LERYEEEWKQVLSCFVASGLEAETWAAFWVADMVPIEREFQYLRGWVTSREDHVHFERVA